MQNDFSSVSSEGDFRTIVNRYFETPDSFISESYETYKIFQAFWAKHNDFKKLDYSQKKKIIEVASLKLLANASSNSSDTQTFGQCEDQRDADKETCLEGALVAAAGCGLLTPTLLGALGCGAFVVLGDAACHRAADRDYEICKQYQ